MDRHWDASGAAAAPAAPVNILGPNVYPQGGASPSEPGPWWFHMVTEEIRRVIEDSGITPSRTDLSQLSAAIQRMISGGDYKSSVRAATTANITLSGEQTIDGVAVVAGDRVLVMAQTAGAENGIYVAATGAWTRAEDANSAGDLTSGVLVPVEEGTLNADTVWMLATDGTITIGTTAQTWQIKSGDATTTRKGQVQLATSAEAQALTDALKAITPSTLAAALQGGNQSLNVNGYQKLPGGLIIQWGRAGTTTSGTETVTLPITFPTAYLNAYATDEGISSTSAHRVNNSLGTTSSINVTKGAGANSDAFNYIAIGY